MLSHRCLVMMMVLCHTADGGRPPQNLNGTRTLSFVSFSFLRSDIYPGQNIERARMKVHNRSIIQMDLARSARGRNEAKRTKSVIACLFTELFL